ncbi:MAG: VgrG-related protein [Chloroflexota bacterium]
MPGPQVPQIAIKVNGSDLSLKIMNDLYEAEVETTLDLPSMFVLRFYDDDNLTLTDGTTLAVGASVQIDLVDVEAEVETFITVMKGEITALEPEFTEDMQLLLTVRGYDKGHRLNRGAKTRVFVNSKDSDIVTKIASEASLTPSVDATTEVFEHLFQDDQTDFAFIHERAHRIGYEVFVDDGKLYFRKPKGIRGDLTLEWGQTLRSFRPRMTLAKQVDKVTVKGWDPATKQAIVGSASSSSISPQIGEGKWGGSAAQSVFSASEHVVVRRPVATQADATSVAQAILDDINAQFVQADGVAFGNPNLVAGKKVQINKVGTRFGGKYVVTSARHLYAASSGYDTYFSVEGARPNQMSDLMGERGDTSLWGGVVTALVTNNNDPKKMARVKIKFPWLDATVESNWARVAGIGAGSTAGLHWLPEVNDEVLVAFEMGDFNRPYVIGNLWNGTDKQPEEAAVKDGKVQIRTLQSREGHKIRLVDDSAGQMIEIIDCKTNTSIKMDTTNKKITIDSKGDIDLTAVGNIKIEATGNLDIKGANVSAKATSALQLEGTSSGSVKSSGILEVKGSMVNIN